MTQTERSLLDDLADFGRRIAEKAEELLTGRRQLQPARIPIPVRDPHPRMPERNDHR
jgi:hypothetical protein